MSLAGRGRGIADKEREVQLMKVKIQKVEME